MIKKLHFKNRGNFRVILKISNRISPKLKRERLLELFPGDFMLKIGYLALIIQAKYLIYFNSCGPVILNF